VIVNEKSAETDTVPKLGPSGVNSISPGISGIDIAIFMLTL